MPLLLCPNCETGMQAVNRNDVQIDICPNCRGVWLDRGELEKLLGSIRDSEEPEERREKEGAYSGGSRRPPDIQGYQERYRYEDRSEQYDIPKERHELYRSGKHSEPRYSKAKNYRKKSAFERLSELFD